MKQCEHFLNCPPNAINKDFRLSRHHEMRTSGTPSKAAAAANGRLSEDGASGRTPQNWNGGRAETSV